MLLTNLESDMRYRKLYWLLAVTVILAGFPAAGSAQSNVIPAGSKVFLAPMNGFETHLRTALETKKVPLVVVDSREQADFEISGLADTKKAGTAKVLITGNWHSREEASIKVTNLKTSEVAFAYSYHTDASTHGQRSSAEACAKHLREKIAEK